MDSGDTSDSIQYSEAVHKLFGHGLYIPAKLLIEMHNVKLKDPGETLYDTIIWLQIHLEHESDYQSDDISFSELRSNYLHTIRYIMSNYIISKHYLKKSLKMICYDFTKFIEYINILMEAESGINFMDEDYVKVIFKCKSEKGLEYLHEHHYLTLELMIKYMWRDDIFLPKVGTWNLEFVGKCLELLAKESAIPTLSMSHIFNTSIQNVQTTDEIINVFDKYDVKIYLNQDLINFIQKSTIVDQFITKLLKIVVPVPDVTFVTTVPVIYRALKIKNIPTEYKKM